VRVYRAAFRSASAHRLTGNDETTFVKLVVDARRSRGRCTHGGAEAGEILQGLAIAVRYGAPRRSSDATLGIHPTAPREFVTLRTAS